MASARNQLLGLHKELDLADAAATQLDVVPLGGNLAMSAIGVDLTLHAVDVRHRGEVEILAPDEGRQTLQERFARADVAGASARLDHGGALPVAANAFVIIERGGGRDGDLGGARVG